MISRRQVFDKLLAEALKRSYSSSSIRDLSYDQLVAAAKSFLTAEELKVIKEFEGGIKEWLQRKLREKEEAALWESIKSKLSAKELTFLKNKFLVGFEGDSD